MSINAYSTRIKTVNYIYAKDAYLNVVVGNVYDTKFTRNVFNFIKDKKDGRKYSLNNVFYENVSNSNTVAWEMNKTVHQVEKVMNNNNILVTRRTSEQKGGLFDATVYKAKVAENAKEGVYYPLKTSNPVVKDVTKYGGFTKVKIAYYSIFEYTLVSKKGEEKITRIIPIPIYISQNIKDDSTLVEFAKSQINIKDGEEVKDFKLKYRKLCKDNYIKLNDYPYYIGGKFNDYIYIDSAIQLILENNFEKYIKLISKYQNWKKENKDGELWGSITEEENKELYKYLVEKMNTSLFEKKKNNKYNEFIDEETFINFVKLEKEKQIVVLIELLNILTNKRQPSLDKKLIGVTVSRGYCGLDISNFCQFSIIEQSVTGFYEKEITIIGDKENDMENNNS